VGGGGGTTQNPFRCEKKGKKHVGMKGEKKKEKGPGGKKSFEFSHLKGGRKILLQRG